MKQDTFKIEKGIPLDTKHKYSYIAAKFEVGDSVLVKDKLEALTLQRNCRNWAYRAKSEAKFVQGEDPAGKGYRVWRVK